MCETYTWTFSIHLGKNGYLVAYQVWALPGRLQYIHTYKHMHTCLHNLHSYIKLVSKLAQHSMHAGVEKVLSNTTVDHHWCWCKTTPQPMSIVLRYCTCLEGNENYYHKWRATYTSSRMYVCSTLNIVVLSLFDVSSNKTHEFEVDVHVQ